MAKSRVKKPITSAAPTSGAKFKRSRVETARLIRRFHVLNKELAKCRNEHPKDTVKEKQILDEMEAMGGLDWYQRASQLGQSKERGGDSSKWLIQALKTECKAMVDTAKKPLQVLDVGAVQPDNYKAYQSWIQAKPIDLNPQHPDIEKQDFLRMQPTDAKFDIVCLSLVVNFVGDPRDRGQMLLHTRNFLFSPVVKDRLHLLYLVLPLPCIDNSRYMSHDHLMAMMASIGYSHCIKHHFSKKLAYYLFEYKANLRPKTAWKKKILPQQEGGGRNNFAIVIDPPSATK
ncbi:putative methyltransferase-domain-containing protein [Radiomyces spectabilis]|uniref:putative methyltransferase-domain-containing protein n=1 Tax=Radiomyces spectabilis TaxID=64574 RepID=UPI00221E5A8D|nr:putative methyltransferase-domain-containing protein [Radiomyces spectabilis]KAI8384522.1 putative methyltransferase-domain-containing protein [Radiomyces spectabilis]